MLYLIGLGLNGDLTLEGVTTARRCRVYLEAYTSFLPLSKRELEKMLQKRVTILTREHVEETQEFLKKARNEDVAVLVVGDPLVATTHVEILIEARKRNIQTEVIHNSSIYSAVAETGLQIYKFGRTVTIPFPYKEVQPTSFLATVQKNKTIGAHTLLLLDVREEEKRYMNPKEAMEILLTLGFEGNVVCISRLGSKNKTIVYGNVKKLALFDKEHWGQPPHCLVVPASLHFKEEEFLQLYEVAE